MRIVIQRVLRARVEAGGREVAAIGAGLLCLVGVARGDGAADARGLARKTARLRLFPGAGGPFDAAVAAAPDRAVLCVSQFTLLGDARRGNRPSWADAAPAGEAAPLVEEYAAALEAEGVPVARGAFGADMEVTLVNDGPVTLVVDSADLSRPRG